MKLNKDKQIDYESNAVFDGYDAKISESDMHKLWDLLQDPYKNPVGAVVREYVSNSFDSHAEAAFIKDNSLADIRNEYPVYRDMEDAELKTLKKQLQVFNNDAVHVTISKDSTGHFWATEDFGVGLSPDRVKDVFASYLKSTKEDTNNVIGAFGIGSKSGLSYTDVVFIRTRYNGIEYQYMLRKGEKSPRLDIVSNQATTERNGTQIKIYIKTVKKYDWQDAQPETDRFQDECIKQLAYFDNVYFTGTNISNDYTIARGINWVKSSNGAPFENLHMCLGKVAYPIDWDSLGIERVAISMALQFEIGELDIIQTREDVKYTPRTKKAIIDKIEALRTELIDKYNNEVGIETDDFLFYLANKDETPFLEYDLGNWSFKLQLYELFKKDKYSSINSIGKNQFQGVTYKPFKKVGIDLKNKTPYEVLAVEFKSGSYINDSGLKHGHRSIWNLMQSGSIMYRIKGDHNTRKSKYIRQALEDSDVFLIRKKTKSEASLKHYVDILSLDWDDRANWRAKIKVFQKELLNLMISKTKSYDNVVIDKDWIADNYGKKRTYDNTKLVAYRLRELGYDPNRNWEKTKMVKGDIDKMVRSTFIVGTKEQRTALNFMALFYSKRSYLKFSVNYRNDSHLHVLFVAPTNLKYFEDAKSVITMENFREQKPFIRAMTAYHIANTSKYARLLKFIKDSTIVEQNQIIDLNPDFTWVKPLKKYFKENDIYGNVSYRTRDLWVDAYKYALEEDIFDKSIIEKMDHLLEYFDFPMFKYLDEYNVSVEALASYIYLFNKVAPKNKRKRLHPIYNINYKQEELDWMSAEQRSIINKIQMRDVSTS